MIHFDIEDPTTVDAAWCFKQYFGELNERMHAALKHNLALPFPNALRLIGDAQTYWHTHDSDALDMA
jgi:hypothetical protein